MIADAGAAIGRAAASLCNLFNPQRVIVGGSLSPAGDLLLDPLRNSIERFAIPSAAHDVKIVRGELGARTETLGALALVIAESDRLVGRDNHPPTGQHGRSEHDARRSQYQQPARRAENETGADIGARRRRFP